MITSEISLRTFRLKKIFLYQAILGCGLATGIVYFKGDITSFAIGFILGQIYAGFTFWLILQLFKRKKRALILGAFVMKWGMLAFVLYILLKKVHAISFIVGLLGFVFFWFALALEDWKKQSSQSAT